MENNKSPIIFLNINGVLISENFIMSLSNSPDLLYRRIGNKILMNFELSKISIIKNIIDETNAYIVISSSWNKDNSLEDFKTIFKQYELDKRVIGITPCLCKKSGYEIKEWLKNNKDNFEYLDKNNISIINNDNIGCLNEYHVKTNSKIGITMDDSKNVIKMLKKKL